jgi:hypothetical protein
MKITLDLTTELTLADLKAFVLMAERAQTALDEPLPFELDDQDQLSGYSVYVNSSRFLAEDVTLGSNAE